MAKGSLAIRLLILEVSGCEKSEMRSRRAQRGPMRFCGSSFWRFRAAKPSESGVLGPAAFGLLRPASQKRLGDSLRALALVYSALWPL